MPRMLRKATIASGLLVLAAVVLIGIDRGPDPDAPSPDSSPAEPARTETRKAPPEKKPEQPVPEEAVVAAADRNSEPLFELTGRLVFPPGVGLDNGRVYLNTPMGVSGSVRRRLTLASDGTFRAEGIPANRYVVGAGVDGPEGRYGGWAYADVPGPEVVITLERETEREPNRWRIRFFLPDGSLKMAGTVFVTFLGNSSLQRSPREIKDGLLELRTPQSLDGIFVEFPKVDEEAGTGAFLAGPLTPGGPDIEFRLTPGVSITGTVVPPEQVVVTAIPARHPWPDSERAPGISATADETGAFSINGLGAEPHLLTVDVPDDYVQCAPVKAVPGEAVRLQLKPAVRAVIEVRGPDDAPIVGASVYLGWPGEAEGEEPLPPGGETDEQGRLELRQLDPDARYRLTLDSGIPFLDEVIENWSPADTVFVVVKMLAIEGIVTDLAGAPVPGARVHLKRPGFAEWEDSEQAYLDGRFSFRRLRPGGWDLGVQIGGPKFPIRHVREVGAGETGVTLAVDAGRQLTVAITNWGKRRETTWPRLTEEGGTVWLRGMHIDDRLFFAGLKSGKSYILQFGPFFDGMLLFERGVTAEVAKLDAALKQGGMIRGKIALPDGARGERVEVMAVGPAFGARGRVNYDGSFEIPGIPDGEWIVKARLQVNGVILSATTRAGPGDSVDLELKR